MTCVPFGRGPTAGIHHRSSQVSSSTRGATVDAVWARVKQALLTGATAEAIIHERHLKVKSAHARQGEVIDGGDQAPGEHRGCASRGVVAAFIVRLARDSEPGRRISRAPAMAIVAVLVRQATSMLRAFASATETATETRYADAGQDDLEIERA